MSPAGPYPTKAMHEALKTRVTALEDVAPGSEAAPSPGLLSAADAGGVRGSGGIVETAIMAYRLTRVADGTPVQFDTLRIEPPPHANFNRVAVTGDGQTLYDSENAAVRHQEVRDAGGVTLTFPELLTADALEVLVDTGEMYGEYGLGRFYPSPVQADPGYTQTLHILEGEPYQDAVATMRLIRPRTVLGSLAPDAMNVVDTPSPLAEGEFEIVDSGSSAPTLRYRSSSGSVYALAMTLE